MCGRFTLTSPADEISEYFRVLEDAKGSAQRRLQPRYNIAPTQPVACVRQTVSADTEPSTPGGPSARELVEMRCPLDDAAERLIETLPKDTPMVFHCHGGGRRS